MSVRVAKSVGPRRRAGRFVQGSTTTRVWARVLRAAVAGQPPEAVWAHRGRPCPEACEILRRLGYAPGALSPEDVRGIADQLVDSSLPRP